MKTDPVLDALRQACQGLLFISESEAPLEPFPWTGTEPNNASAAARAGAAVHAPVECITLDQFFRAVSKEDRPQFDKLGDVLRKNLSAIQVYKVGEAEKAVFIVGKTADGRWLGVKTTVVET